MEVEGLSGGAAGVSWCVDVILCCVTEVRLDKTFPGCIVASVA